MTSFRDYAVEAINQRLDKMYSLIPAVRQAEDIEPIHDMRVASRRLRAALTVFASAFPGKRYAQFDRAVKSVTDSLSEARDLDVMIEAVHKLEEALPEGERAGIAGFVEELQRSRHSLDHGIERALTEMEQRDLRTRFAALIADDRETSPHETPLLNGSEQREETIEERFRQGITARMWDLMAFEPHIEHPERVLELHSMRIAAKKLRYTMELFAPFAVGGFDKAINRVRNIQELLGKIHDADVLTPKLTSQIRSLARGCRDVEKGAHCADFDALLGVCKACRWLSADRDDTYEQFLRDWKTLRLEGFFDSLWSMANGVRIPKPSPAPKEATVA